MKSLHQIPVLLVVIFLAGGAWVAVQASTPEVHVPPNPPLPEPDSYPNAAATALAGSVRGLPPLRAVLIVGPIDGDDGPWTTLQKQRMEWAASELEANGVAVHRFYTPRNDWSDITAAAQGAHFLFYRGHGISWNAGSEPTVGGFFLKDRLVSPDDIRHELHLAPNAIVMLFGCFASGTMNVEEGTINSELAWRRVEQYSAPFLDGGAAGYYANWFGDAFLMYVRYLFQGMTLGQAYEAFHDFDGATVERYPYPDLPDQVIWLDKDYRQESWLYNNAFAGLPDQTLGDLFGTDEPQLEVMPSTITRLAEPDAPPRIFQLHIEGASSDAIRWSAMVPEGADWLDVQPQTGTSGQTVSVVITPTGQALGTWQATVHIVATSAEAQNTDYPIPVTLHVQERVHTTYLPMAVKSGP